MRPSHRWAAVQLLLETGAAIRFQVPLTNDLFDELGVGPDGEARAEASPQEGEPAVDPAEQTKFMDPYRSQMASLVENMLHMRNNGITYDEQFFKDTCDLSEHNKETFDTEGNKVSTDKAVDDARWSKNKKCENAGIGTATLMKKENFLGSAHECAQLCATASGAKAGHAVCCEYHQDRKECIAEMGWQALQDSSWGTWSWWRKAKFSRLVFTSSVVGDYAPKDEEGEATETTNDQSVITTLLTEVNAMSIDGILDHLLSFYICMRWVPDVEFVDLAKFELAEVSVDEKTPAVETVTRDDVMRKVLDADLTPLRCTSQVNVQNIDKIEEYLQAFKTPSSDMNRLSTFSQQIHEAGEEFTFTWAQRINRVNTAMYYNATKNTDSVFVEDMRSVARDPKMLPWPTFVRSSNDYDHHKSSSKNLFMICFGPRIASYPHKRANGKYILADQNMAGCNGFWDIATMASNMDRIKKLFAPEMCFEFALRRELKAQFLRTFISMNEEFDKAMSNTYTKKVHALDPTQGKIDLSTLGVEDPDAVGNGRKLEKYKNIASLVAKAHAKWIICPTKPSVTGGIGTEDNVFRTAKAYEKWIGKLVDDTIPECRTMDDTTGCTKCIIAVKDVHNCHVRMNVTMTSLLKAIKDRKYDNYESKYKYAENTEPTDGSPAEWKVNSKSGVCLARKSAHTTAIASQTGVIQDLQDSFYNMNDTDQIVRLITDEDPGEGGFIEAEYITSVKKRRAHFHDRNLAVPENELQYLLAMLDEDRLSDKQDDWKAKYIFTDSIAARNNRQAFKVDYFVSCPCALNDHKPEAHFKDQGSQGLAEYWNR